VFYKSVIALSETLAHNSWMDISCHRGHISGHQLTTDNEFHRMLSPGFDEEIGRQTKVIQQLLIPCTPVFETSSVTVAVSVTITVTATSRDSHHFALLPQRRCHRRDAETAAVAAVSLIHPPSSLSAISTISTSFPGIYCAQ
jgi:hypothetical protein